jgi:uncharacterized membrane protein YfcA
MSRRTFQAGPPDAVDILHSTPPGDLGVFALGLVIAAIVGGLASGTLGVGGGIIVVPVLYHVMAALGVEESVRMQLTAGTSLAAMIPASLSRARYARAGIDWLLLERIGLPIICGVLAGIVFARWASGRVLAIAFAVVAFPFVLYLALGERSLRIAARLPESVGTLFFPAFIGGASTATGVGGDTLGLPAMTLLEVPEQRMSAMTSALGVMVAVAGAMGAVVSGWNAPALPPGSYGFVNLIGFALIAPVLLPAEGGGSALRHLMDMKRLRLTFALLIAIATARMLWDALA